MIALCIEIKSLKKGDADTSLLSHRRTKSHILTQEVSTEDGAPSPPGFNIPKEQLPPGHGQLFPNCRYKIAVP